MDVKEFFYSGGVVACKDRTEGDVVIEICRNEGLVTADFHDPDGNYHGVHYYVSGGYISFYLNGCSDWERGVPFDEWMTMFGVNSSKVEVDDLL